MERKGPSFFQVLWTDYGATLSALAIIIFWGLRSFYRLANRGVQLGSWNFLLLAITVICLGVIFWRFRRISAFFDRGREVQGSVTHVRFFRDRGWVTCTYSINGESHKSTNLISRNGRTSKLSPGQDVLLLVDPDKPESAIIRELYV